MSDITFYTMEDVVNLYLSQTPSERHIMDAMGAGRELSESPLESMFWHFMEKTKTEAWDDIKPQCKTGHRRLDAMLVADGIKIDLELDGKAWHDLEKDAVRDAELLTSGAVDEVIRIEAPAMLYYQYATMLSLSCWHGAFYVRPPAGCMTWHEWIETKTIHLESEQFYHNEDFDDWCENSAEVSLVVSDRLGVVGSPKLVESFVDHGGKAPKITRKRRSDIHETRNS
jgi:very-short-patch-repair endonuclease